MASEIEICNMALVGIGGPVIEALDDSTTASKLCKLFYPTLRDACLRSANWNFAMTRKVLGRDAVDPISGFAAQYSLPGECIRVVEVEESEGGYVWKVEGRKLLIDTETCTALFVARVEPGLFDALFTTALSSWLASEVAWPLLKDAAAQKNFYAIAQEKIREARNIDGIEGRMKRISSNELVDVGFE